MAFGESRRVSNCEWLANQMYVTTLYSFKGGVGRTMALVNAAVELALRGRRVLAVDFDLEAPGLDTFDIFHSKKRGPGIIDFVREYLVSGQAPEVGKFVESSAIGDSSGELWVMPSGTQKETYAADLSQIDWGELYERRDGYLLFEDLKRQWEHIIRPDYVLIDSRTGHTDTGGICTRQLPEAVAMFFFPNEQNLRGLTKVVRDIRSEAGEARKKEITLHFVMSNVPDLDDEDSILEGKIDAFQNQLGFKREPMVVHRYDSLSLLNQVVFTKDRPRSRLAKEYREVVQEIVRHNPADRDGALDYIRRTSRLWRRREKTDESPRQRDSRLQDLENAHSGDGEVLFRLGMLWEDDRQSERAASLFERAIEVGYNEPEAYLRRARIRADQNDADGASEDALRVLQSDRLPSPGVREAVLLASSGHSVDVAESAAVVALNADERIWLANTLSNSREQIKVAVSVLQPIINDDGLPEEERASARNLLTLAYIGIQQFAEALTLLRHGGCDAGDMDIQNAFNYGMAMWGETGDIVREPFARAVELHQSDPQSREDPNYLQCMAVAYWAAGDAARAIELAGRAREVVLKREISCWRYYKVAANEFRDDLDEILELIGGDTSRIPRFMAEADREPPGHTETIRR